MARLKNLRLLAIEKRPPCRLRTNSSHSAGKALPRPLLPLWSQNDVRTVPGR